MSFVVQDLINYLRFNCVTIDFHGEKRIQTKIAGKRMRIPLDDLETQPTFRLNLAAHVQVIKEDIKKHGQITPIIVRCMYKRHYRVLDGYCRVLALRELGHKTVFAVNHYDAHVEWI